MLKSFEIDSPANFLQPLKANKTTTERMTRYFFIIKRPLLYTIGTSVLKIMVFLVITAAKVFYYPFRY